MPLDVLGRQTSDAAQRVYDSRLQTPNLVGNRELERRAGRQFESFMKAAEVGRHSLNNKLTVMYQLWNGQPISTYTSSIRSVHVPEPHKQVEALVPRVVDILTGRQDWFRVIGIDETGKKNQDAIEKLLKQQLRLDGFGRKLPLLVRAFAIYGWIPAKIYWKQRRRQVRYSRLEETAVRVGGALHGRNVESREAVAQINNDGPTCEMIDPFHFHTVLRYRDHQDGPGLATSAEISEEELLDLAKRGWFKNVPDLINAHKHPRKNEVRGPMGTHLNPTSWVTMRGMADGLHETPYGLQEPSRRYEVWEYWGKFDPNYDPILQNRTKEKEFCIHMGRQVRQGESPSGWIPLRIAENPYWHGLRPVLVAHYTRRPHAFQSKGLLEPCTRLFRELDDLRSMALQATALAAKPILVADDNADIMGSNLVLDAGDVLRVRNTDAIKPLHIPDKTDVAYKGEAIIKRDIEETGGVHRMFAGGGPERQETATATVSHIREANKRIAEPARSMAMEFIVPMLEMWLAMDQQMMTREREIELIGEDGLHAGIRKLGPEEIAGRVHIEMTTTPQIEMAGIKSRMRVNFLNAAVPFMAPDMPNPPNIDSEHLLMEAYADEFGPQGIEKIFLNANRPAFIRSSQDEHELIAMGHMVEVQDGESIEAHLRGHTIFMTQPQSPFHRWPPDAQMKLRAHIENTRRALAREAEEKVIPQMLEMARQPAMLPPPGDQGQGQGQPPGMQAQPMQRRAMGPSPTATGMVRSNIAGMEPRTPQGDL